MKVILGSRFVDNGTVSDIYSEALYTVYDDEIGENERVKGSVLISAADDVYSNLERTEDGAAFTKVATDCGVKPSCICIEIDSEKVISDPSLPVEVGYDPILWANADKVGGIMIGGTKLQIRKDLPDFPPEMFRPEPYVILTGDGGPKFTVYDDDHLDSIAIENFDYIDGVLYGELIFNVYRTMHGSVGIFALPLKWDTNNMTANIGKYENKLIKD